jgi:hypothetical protein
VHEKEVGICGLAAFELVEKVACHHSGAEEYPLVVKDKSICPSRRRGQ